jgi:hypothetical protein
MLYNAKENEEYCQLIKKITENELVSVLLSDVKVVLPEELKDLNQIKFKEKVNKKKLKKEEILLKEEKSIEKDIKKQEVKESNNKKINKKK